MANKRAQIIPVCTYTRLTVPEQCEAPFCSSLATVAELRDYGLGKTIESTVCENHRIIKDPARTADSGWN